jgi:hypothetical protein
MSTISENLQTIKSSTEAIKQAIIDKGGTISGDITTWADAISGISGGSSDGDPITFTGTISYSGSTMYLNGVLSSKPETSGPVYLVLLYLGTSIAASKWFVMEAGVTMTPSIDAGEPLMGSEMPALCLVESISGKVRPVIGNLSIYGGGSGGAD